MRIIITGGSGFIGTNLIDYIIENSRFNFINIDVKQPILEKHRRFWVRIDINNLLELTKIINEYKPSHVINLAADVGVDLKDISEFKTNIKGVQNILQACNNKDYIKHIIFTSTLLVCKIGYHPKYDTDYCPNTVYGESKVEGEELVRNFRNPSFCWTIVRPISIWGPWCNEPYFNFFKSILKGWYFHIGRGDYKRSLGYVGNTVQHLLSILDCKKEKVSKKTFYLADLDPTDLKTMSEIIRHESDSSKIHQIPLILAKLLAFIGDVLKATFRWRFVPLTSFRLNNILTEYVYDLKPIHEIMKIEPISLKSGIKTTIKNVKSRL